MRILIAGIAGGIVLFMWGAFSHMVLPIGEIGIKTMPNEAQVIGAMKSSITEPGFYYFPGIEGGHRGATEEQQAAWEAKFRSGPHGTLIYHPTGTDPMPPRMLITELVSNILAAIAVALVVSWLICFFWGRVIAAGLFGLVSWLSVDASYWNWYGFPTEFFLSQAVDQVVGWLLAGFVIAWLVKGRSGE
jgi:hypothetical protein